MRQKAVGKAGSRESERLYGVRGTLLECAHSIYWGKSRCIRRSVLIKLCILNICYFFCVNYNSVKLCNKTKLLLRLIVVQLEIERQSETGIILNIYTSPIILTLILILSRM